jgi:hypothetical protein
MSDQTTLNNTHNATSSQESGAGHTPCSLQDGHQSDLFGQDHALASHFLPQDDKKVKQMIDTYGPYGSASSASYALLQSLESKLAARLPTGGLMMFIKGWKRKVTPLGRLYCQLAVSVRPISAIDCGLWATPNVMDHMKARSIEALDRAKTKGGCSNLKDQIHPALWPTPTVRDHKDTGDLSNSMTRKDGKSRLDGIPRLAYGSTAQTGNKGSLNPQFPCWLMGYPAAWDDFAPTETP